MRSVAVIGIGKTAFGAFPDRDLRSLAVEAGEKCFRDAGAWPTQIESFFLGNFAGPSFTGQNHLAPYISTALDMPGIPSTRVEDACASGGSAFYHAWREVSSGMSDIVMALGVEKMTSQPTQRVTEILAAAGDMATEGRAGATFPSLFAMIARRHMFQYGTTREHLAAVAVKNHENGALNPDAHMRKTITLEQALAGRPIADPLTLYDCSLISDGAAAVILAPLERAREFTDHPSRILGIAQASDFVALDQKPDITTFAAVRAAAYRAYGMAGMGPRDIDFAELHDCFTIAEIIAMEDLGFVDPGCGGYFSAAGETRRSGSRPVNLSGGLKSKGHPVGATGIAQICDVVKELRAGRKTGLAQNLGGSGATCVVSILGAA
jgi:acetyl-CoA C-acetyltransferase